MTDRDHAEAIRAAAFKLNAAIEAAAKAQVFVELSIGEHQHISRPAATPVVFVKPFKPL